MRGIIVKGCLKERIIIGVGSECDRVVALELENAWSRERCSGVKVSFTRKVSLHFLPFFYGRKEVGF